MKKTQHMNNLKKDGATPIMGPLIKLGLLGGGQLARMLALSAAPYGIQSQVFAKDSLEPAAQVTPFVYTGSPDDKVALKAFLSQCDVVTFESEFLNASLLTELCQETQTPVYPSPSLMGELQDRLTQKQLLFKHKIPTAPYVKVHSWSDWPAAVALSSSLVLKQRRFGYDGYGTFFVKAHLTEAQWNDLQAKSAYGFIAEAKINFKRELALLLARDRHGRVIDFPLVESKQTQARCDWVMGPVKHPKEATLRKSLHLFLKKINYVGVMAFELFDTGKELLVNEIAPRVHNSGHYSINALTLSQFQAHVLAVAGFQLPKPRVISPFAMTNLLGQSSNSPLWNKDWFYKNPTAQLHWYGKRENRLGRKMGHINTIDKTSSLALRQAILARRKVQL